MKGKIGDFFSSLNLSVGSLKLCIASRFNPLIIVNWVFFLLTQFSYWKLELCIVDWSNSITIENWGLWIYEMVVSYLWFKLQVLYIYFVMFLSFSQFLKINCILWPCSSVTATVQFFLLLQSYVHCTHACTWITF